MHYLGDTFSHLYFSFLLFMALNISKLSFLKLTVTCISMNCLDSSCGRYGKKQDHLKLISQIHCCNYFSPFFSPTMTTPVVYICFSSLCICLTKSNQNGRSVKQPTLNKQILPLFVPDETSSICYCSVIVSIENMPV